MWSSSAEARRVLLRLLAGRRRLGRGRGGEEALPPGQDLRRRPDPPGRAPAGRHGTRGRPGRLAQVQRAPGLRLRPVPRDAVARAPQLPQLRLHHHPPRPRRPGGRAGGQGRGHPLGRDRGGGPDHRRGGADPSPRPPPCYAASPSRTRRPATERRDDPGPLRRGGRRGQLAGRPHAGHQSPPRPPTRAWPCAGYYTSDRHDDPFIESHLDIRDAEGNVVPGYGWIFPMGDGRVNVGVGLLSTDRRWKGVNTSHLMDAFVDWAPKSWGLSPETCLGPPTGGKLPMGLSVGPAVGRQRHPGRRRRRDHQPLQRRGHRLRLRDRPPGRRRARPRPQRPGRARPSPTTTASSRPPTAPITRWPGPSCA